MEASFDRLVLENTLEVQRAADAAVQTALARAVVHWAEKVAHSYTNSVERVGELSLDDLRAIYSALPSSTRTEDVIEMLNIRLMDVWRRLHGIEAGVPWEIYTYEPFSAANSYVIAVRPKAYAP